MNYVCKYIGIGHSVEYMKVCKAGNSETFNTGSASRDPALGCDRQVWLWL